MHDFLLGGVGCLAYVRRDPPVHVVRFVRYVTLIKSGDDIKTVQENLGHAAAAFTLDVYGHVTKQMNQERFECLRDNKAKNKAKRRFKAAKKP